MNCCWFSVAVVIVVPIKEHIPRRFVGVYFCHMIDAVDEKIVCHDVVHSSIHVTAIAVGGQIAQIETAHFITDFSEFLQYKLQRLIGYPNSCNKQKPYARIERNLGTCQRQSDFKVSSIIDFRWY